MGRRGRAEMWKLLLPFPLAVLIVIAAVLGGRQGWDVRPKPSPEARPGRRAPQAPARGLARPAEAVPSAEAREPGAGFARESAPANRAAEASVVRREELAGPALEAVAPSFKAALRISGPPPAVARAPSLAPAPTLSLVPAPEPREGPRVAPGQVARPAARAPKWARDNVRSVRFDAAYYYGRSSSVRQLAEELTEAWAEQGINLVYFYAYNRVYGARYVTHYAGNTMEDFGRQDLLGHVLREAHRRGIKVVAWLQGVQHKPVWESHPGWREKTRDGGDYKPDRDSYFLCVRNPEVMKWWMGFLDDLLTRYPELDGVDLAECQVDLWGDHACYCEHCNGQFAQEHPGAAAPGKEWREFRAEGLTRLLLASSRLVHSYGKETHLTTVFTAGQNGKLMASEVVRDAIGFDLEGVLNSPDRPEVIQAELIWQQWAAIYGDRNTFRAEWTQRGVQQAKEMVRGRARLVAHVEVTDFGGGRLDGPGLARTIAAAVQGEPYGVDIYDAHLLEGMEGAGQHLRIAWLSFAE